MKPFLVLAAFLMLQNPVVSTTVSGRITVDDGSSVPTVNTFRGPNVMVGIQASVPGVASRIAEATTQADGSFAIPLDLAGGMGQFAIEVTRLPLGYHIKSMRYGSMDLVRSPLILLPTTPVSDIQVVLTKTPPAGTLGFMESLPGDTEVSCR